MVHSYYCFTFGFLMKLNVGLFLFVIFPVGFLDFLIY